MKTNFVDCFMLMGTALSLRNGQRLPEMGRPLLQDVYTTIVNVSLTLTQIYFENSQNMEVKLTFLLDQRWIDPRLGANEQTRKLAVNGKIWRPYITAIEGESYIKENELTQFWRGIGSEGNVQYSEKMLLQTLCTRNFRKFPFDTQTCSIKLGTYRFPKEEVELVWNHLPFVILTGEDFGEFRLINVETYTDIEIRSFGNFSVLVAQITIKRHFEHYLFCTIIPSIILVSVSYLTFWLNIKNISARHFLSGLNLCVLIFFYHKSICTTIILPYMKALDIFIFICILFVLVTLLENLVADVIIRKEMDEEYQNRSFHKATEFNYGLACKLMDRIACIIFPVMFISIMIFYCILFVV